MLRPAVAASSLLLALAASPPSSAAPATGPDPARVVGPEECAQCHEKEVEAWRGTHHNASFGIGDDIPDAIMEELIEKEPLVEKWAGALGIEGFDEPDSLCAGCHVTLTAQDGEPEVIAGVSCESCHGAALHWLNVHYDYGQAADGAKKTREQEDAAHREERLRKAREGGMLRPESIHLVAANCFGCHTVPNEKLVNETGHPAGSDGFELVSWSQGEVRHNFLADQSKNAPTSLERRRLLYLVGAGMDVEYSLGLAASASGEGRFLEAARKRVGAAVTRLKTVSDAAAGSGTSLAAVDAILAAVPASVAAGSASASARDAVRPSVVELAGTDVSSLGFLDALLPSESGFKGKPHP